mgnify:CR=1 FL=1
MTLSQDSMSLLNEKIDALYQMIEQLNLRLSTVLSDSYPLTSHEPITDQLARTAIRQKHRSFHSSYLIDDTGVEHRDVINETNYLENDHPAGDQELSAEVQIQRLTAQLTAAYNRIAALEEQLLAQRIQ